MLRHTPRTARRTTLVAALGITALALLTACGLGPPDSSGTDDSSAGGGDSSTSSGDAGGGTSGQVANPQPAGTAYVQVDGLEITLTDAGGLQCSVSTESVTFAFREGDNAITLGGGMNATDGGWMGSIDFRIADPESEPGPITYFPAMTDGLVDGDVGIDGASFSYSGPMMKQPPNDGSNPDPVTAGDAVISITCP